MIIEIFKSFRERFTFAPLSIKDYEVGKYQEEGQHVLLFYPHHERISSEQLRLFAGRMDDDSDDIKFILDWGFCLTNEIDCSIRKEDRYDTMIYWFELYVPPDRMTKEDKEFIKEYFENPYYHLKVFNKYGIN